MGGVVKVALCPPAGAGSAFFRPIMRALPDFASAVAFEPRGRERRANMREATTVEDLVADALDDFGDLTDSCVVGHSLGAVVAFEVALRATSLGHTPRCLIVSGSPPQAALSARKFLKMSDRAVLDLLTDMGSLPDAMLRFPRLLESIVAAFRADMSCLSSYEIEVERPLPIPIFTAWGSRDEVAPPDLVSGWAKLTTNVCTGRLFEGGHHYMLRDPQGFVAWIVEMYHELMPEKTI